MSAAPAPELAPVRPAVYTAKQVAGLIGVSVPTVYALAASGQLPHKRVGRKYIFPRDPIHEWLNTPDPEPNRHG